MDLKFEVVKQDMRVACVNVKRNGCGNLAVITMVKNGRERVEIVHVMILQYM